MSGRKAIDDGFFGEDEPEDYGAPAEEPGRIMVMLRRLPLRAVMGFVEWADCEVDLQIGSRWNDNPDPDWLRVIAVMREIAIQELRDRGIAVPERNSRQPEFRMPQAMQLDREGQRRLRARLMSR